MDKQLKLCVDCEHYYNSKRHMRGCSRNIRARAINLVDGTSEILGDLQDCMKERNSDSEQACGMRGKYWEPKEGK